MTWSSSSFVVCRASLSFVPFVIAVVPVTEWLGRGAGTYHNPSCAPPSLTACGCVGWCSVDEGDNGDGGNGDADSDVGGGGGG